ncbi:MAG: response regulator transcription factor [Deltaproteobacteria bacterium]|nr:response regulator transcription factor [Deltaproteobacteria bacterium]MBI3294742.1 response regulator transcription factor [Deltaproteobacteria bacterium]
MSGLLLLIDDDQDWRAKVEAFLPKYGFQVTTVARLEEALKILKQGSVAFVVLDLMVPGQIGLQVCKQIRMVSDVPLLFATERADATDKIVGLEMGADDYIAKPVEPRELLARIQAILRRPKFIEKRRTLRFDNLDIFLKERRAKLDGKDLELTTMEFEILALLADKPGEPFNRDQIMDHLRGAEYECYSRTIDVLLSRLRQKLKDDPKNPRFIKTLWGTGYTFIASSD